MERLTNDKGELIKNPGVTCARMCDEAVFCSECPVGQALQKLAVYERLATPEQIMEFNRLYLEKCQEVNRLKGG